MIAAQLTELAPFLTPAAPAESAATPTPTLAPTPTPAAQSAPVPAPPGLITGFEPLGTWQRGDEPYGTLSQSTAQRFEGAASAELRYEFPAAAGNRNYVVLLPAPALRIGDGASGLQIQVYGDGSGHYLNVWVGDATNVTWQFTFGQIRHTGWQAMNASFALDQPWPNGPIGETTITQLTPPLVIKALVLDGVPDGVASQGVIYLDALRGFVGTAPPASAPPQAAEPVAPSDEREEDSASTTPAESAPVNANALRGLIAYPVLNGQVMDVVVYNVATGSRGPQLPSKRQPDFHRGGGLLLVNGDVGDPDHIVRVSLSGGTQSVTAHPEDAYPQWSPSGQSVVFASTHHGDGRWRLYYQEDASAQFDPPALVFSGREIFGRYPVYLDNWRIAYQGCNSWAGGSSCGIYTTDTKGGQPNQVTTLTADIPTDSLGTQILFMSNRAGNYDVYAVNWDGSGLRQLTTSPGNDGLATASPDFQHIAFLSDRDGAWAVYVMNADGSGQQKLFDVNGGYGGGERAWYEERLSWGP